MQKRTYSVSRGSRFAAQQSCRTFHPMASAVFQTRANYTAQSASTSEPVVSVDWLHANLREPNMKVSALACYRWCFSPCLSEITHCLYPRKFSYAARLFLLHLRCGTLLLVIHLRLTNFTIQLSSCSRRFGIFADTSGTVSNFTSARGWKGCR